MAWVLLGLAALFEILFAVSMKQSNGFTKLGPTLLTVVGVIGGITLLTFALKTLPVSIGYPIWVSIGTLGTVVFGAVVLGETINLVTIVSIAAILLGVAGLKISVGNDLKAESVEVLDEAG